MARISTLLPTTLAPLLAHLAHPRLLLAQVKEVPLGGTIEGSGPFGTGLDSAGAANSQFASILSTSIGAMTVGAGIWFTFQILMGAISWIGAGGDKNALQQAQKRITSAIIGIVIVLASLVIVALVGGILGYDILNFDIQTLVK